jgi:hypothetical protein
MAVDIARDMNITRVGIMKVSIMKVENAADEG